MFEGILATLAEALTRAGIPYMVIGGQAVLIYGDPRLTRDIDITLGVSIDQFEQVMAALEGLPLEALASDPAKLARQTMALPLVHTSTKIRVDLIFSFSLFERDAIGRAEDKLVGSALVKYVAVEDLIVMKLVAGRPRDIEDVKSILRRNPGLDREAVRERLGLFREVVDDDPVAAFDSLTA